MRRGLTLPGWRRAHFGFFHGPKSALSKSSSTAQLSSWRDAQTYVEGEKEKFSRIRELYKSIDVLKLPTLTL